MKKSKLCEKCKVQDFGMCPCLVALYDNGRKNPAVKSCKWHDFFENVHEDIILSEERASIRKNRRTA